MRASSIVMVALMVTAACSGNGGAGGQGGSSGMGGTGGSAGTGGQGGTSGGGGSGGTAGSSGSGGQGGAGGSGPTIVIKNFAFQPDNLSVAPGDTVTVDNRDVAPHSVTSESAFGDYRPGAVDGVSFDTGTFSMGTRTFTIPATATAGTVVHYFCSVHRGEMVGNAQPTVTVVSP